MFLANIKIIDKELASHRLELRTLLQSETQTNIDTPKTIKFNVPRRGSQYESQYELQSVIGTLTIKNSSDSPSTGLFHNQSGGSMYSVSGDVSHFWERLTPDSPTPSIPECINVTEIQTEHHQYCYCEVQLRLDGYVITIHRLEVYR